MLRSFDKSELLAARSSPDQLLCVCQCPFGFLYLGGQVLQFLWRALRDTGGGDCAQDARDISMTEGAAGGPDSRAQKSPGRPRKLPASIDFFGEEENVCVMSTSA